MQPSNPRASSPYCAPRNQREGGQSLDENSFETALNKVYELVKFRETKRRSAYETEVATFCEEYIDHKSMFSSEISNLIEFIERQEEAWATNKHPNDVSEPLAQFGDSLSEIIYGAKRERFHRRAERVKLHYTAIDRVEFEYFEDSIFKLLDEEERDAIRALFALISGSFERGEEEHYHEFAYALNRMSSLKLLIRKVSENPTAGSHERLSGFLRELISDLEDAREVAEKDSARLATLRDRLRRKLNGL